MFTPRPTGRESNRLGAYLLRRYPIDVESTSDWETLPLRSPFGLTAAHSLPKRNMPSFCGLCIARSDHERRRSARELALPSTHLARQLGDPYHFINHLRGPDNDNGDFRSAIHFAHYSSSPAHNH